MNNETNLQRLIMVALSRAGCVVWRNNVGNGFVGRVVYRDDGTTVTLEGARRIQFGLVVGSADLIGIAPGGRFLAVEVKTDRGRVTTEQQTFIDAVNARGGIAGVARSVDDALALLRG